MLLARRSDPDENAVFCASDRMLKSTLIAKKDRSRCTIHSRPISALGTCFLFVFDGLFDNYALKADRNHACYRFAESVNWFKRVLDWIHCDFLS